MPTGNYCEDTGHAEAWWKRNDRGAANAGGKVMVLVAEADWLSFVEFTIDGNVIVLVAKSGLHSRTYGNLTVDAARCTGNLIALRVDEAGKPPRSAAM